jgi:hypothetical protein
MPAARRSRQSVLHHGRGHGKIDGQASGPVVHDPEDGTVRTPKGLLHPGAFQIPAKQIVGFMSTMNDDISHIQSNISDVFMDKLPGFLSIGQFSTIGSSLPYNASEAVEDTSQPPFADLDPLWQVWAGLRRSVRA